MDEKNEDDDSNEKWRGESGLGSGFTGGDHLQLHVMLPLLWGLFVVTVLVQRPLWMLGWLAPVVVFTLGAVFAKKRNRPTYFICVLLTALSALIATVAAMMPTASEDDQPMSRPMGIGESSK